MNDIGYNSGIYLLELNLSKSTKIKIGAKGVHKFLRGYYYYCGSAQNNLQARIKRHLSTDKNFHWHIDYLLVHTEIIDYKTWPYSSDKECKLASILKENQGQIIMQGFGSSDCSCDSHLYFYQKSLLDDIIIFEK